MTGFKIYRILYRTLRSVLHRIPIPRSCRDRLIHFLKRFVPESKFLLRGVSSPVQFSLMNESFNLMFRTEDLGDLGIVSVILTNGVYEPELVNNLGHLLKNGDVFIDGGAHIGYISLVASKFVGPDGRVFAFEPSSRSFEMCKTNVLYNKKSSTISVYNLALWNAEGYINMAIPNSSTSTKRADIAEDGLTIEQVKTSDLDSFCRNENIVPSLIKLDVEGSELEVFRGMSGLLKDPQIRIITEINLTLINALGLTVRGFLEPLVVNGFLDCHILMERAENNRHLNLLDDIDFLEQYSRRRIPICLFVKA